MASEQLVQQTRDTFLRLRLQANSDPDALKTLVDLMAWIGAASQPSQESKVFLKSCGWWPMGQETLDILCDHVVFSRGNIIWRGFDTEGEPLESASQ